MRTVHILLMAAAAALAGCALISNENLHHAVEFDSDHAAIAVRAQYRTVAVLPFFNQTESASAGKYARRSFYGTLAAYKNYTLQPLADTDRRLAALPRKSLDPQEYQDLARVLGTDLIAFGWVERQMHSYAVVYGRNAVTVRIALVDARTGKTVWESTDARARMLMGISVISLFDNEYMWAREIVNRYDELFRDMMTSLPDTSVTAHAVQD